MDKKEAIYALYHTSPAIDKSNLRSTTQYLDDFYRVIASEGILKREFLENCRR
jgi:hypothetical protein